LQKFRAKEYFLYFRGPICRTVSTEDDMNAAIGSFHGHNNPHCFYHCDTCINMGRMATAIGRRAVSFSFLPIANRSGGGLVLSMVSQASPMRAPEE
jgi:uncharacterized protein YlaI